MLNNIEKLKTTENCVTTIVDLLNSMLTSEDNINNSKVDNNSTEENMKYKNIKISKRTDGRWFARFTENKKRVSIYADTQKLCYEKLKLYFNNKENQFEKKITTPLLIANTLSNSLNLKFGEFFEEWRNLYKINKVKDTTLHKLDLNAKKYLSDLYDYSLENINGALIQNKLNNINGARQRQHIYTIFKDVFDKAYKLNKIKYNPMVAVQIPKHTKTQTKAFTYEQEIILEKEFSSYIALLLCLYQGFRIGEALALSWEDIDFENKTISINKTLNSFYKISTPKTQTSIRTVPMFKRTEILLKNLNKEEPLIKDTKATVYSRFKEIMEKLKYHGYTIHSLRHTFATRGQELGITPKQMQQWLGHSTVEMTLNIYTHINKDFEQKQVALMNREDEGNFDTISDTISDTNFLNKKTD